MIYINALAPQWPLISCLANESINAMRDTPIRLDQTDEALAYEVSDEALETAAGTAKEKVGNFTISYCTGLVGCPSLTSLDRRNA